ncbi:uncharacterized protein VTP21DRAFT_6601 [Calcarisporiella thermophila]|uniref:uncharacterized protein n=1 Tax=Calcarisporiella thermophila TaxID=911321 RepID=UPI003743D64D
MHSKFHLARVFKVSQTKTWIVDGVKERCYVQSEGGGELVANWKHSSRYRLGFHDRSPKILEMSRFVRASKFRHVFGTPAKREACYDNLKVSNNAWDTNLVKVNPLFIAVNWQASGGGAFAVIPHGQVGKQPENLTLYRGHTAAVLDTDFANYNDYVIASASEDGKVMIWNIPEEIPEEMEHVSPVAKLSGHGRKVGHVLFHPVADNVLASSSADLTIKLWDIEKGTSVQEIVGHTEIIQSMAWNWNGSLLATTCRDRKLRIIDVRANTIVQETAGHQGVKGSRAVWLGDTNRLATTGFSKMSDRQLFVWDTDSIEKPVKSIFLDTSAGVIMPFYDCDTKMLYLAGKGDGNIRYYEYENDEMFFLSEYKSPEPQRGMAFLPKRAVNVNECEIARAYKVGNGIVEPISFTVPRKSDAFQSDIYPATIGDEPALTADEFFAGKNANPKLIDLEKGFSVKEKKQFVTKAVQEEEKDLGGPKTEKEYQEAYHTLRHENEELKNQVSQKDVQIRLLEFQLDQLKKKLEALNTGASTEKSADDQQKVAEGIETSKAGETQETTPESTLTAADEPKEEAKPEQNIEEPETEGKTNPAEAEQIGV